MSRLFPGLKVLSSMRLRIGLLYLALSVVNIVILTAMIFENQLDMLRLNFRLQSDRIAGTVLTRLEELDPSRIDDLNTLDRVLNENHIISYVIFTERGDKLFEKAKEASVLPATGQVEEPVRRSVLQLRPTALIRQRYTIELNESDYSAQYTMSLPGGRFEQPGYIHAIMRIADFEARYRLLYRQAALAAGLVFLAHLIFALIAIRIFFRRIGLLAHASEHLAEGNLAARASWTMNRMDEVDLLGTTFNHMAQKIQSTVDALSGLNTEIQNELTIGKEVQEQFLPDAKSLAKWNAAAISRPLREVSGDVYTFFQAGGQDGVFFADASGHGVSAALITSLALLSLERIQETAYSAEEMALQMNAAIINHLKTSMFYMTGVFALFDGDRIHYVNGGHPAPILIRKNGDIEILDPTGPPLGIKRDVSFEAGSIEASSGDRLFLYSDGLIESPSPEGTVLDIEDVVNILMEHPDPTEAVNQIMLALDALLPVVRDDISILYLGVP